MSYCVNCGVELADSEKHCPLCDTEVINPNRPWTGEGYRPYPSDIDSMMEHIDRRYIASLLTSILIIPVFVTLVCNLAYGGVITWSAYVMGAAVMLFVWFILPFYFKSYKLLIFLALDCLSIILYLLFINLVVNKVNWFFPVGLPISLCFSVLLLISAWLFRRGNGQLLLVRLSIIMIDISILCFVIEVSTDLYVHDIVNTNWSPFVVVPCLVLAVIAQIIERRKNLKEEIRKRIYY